MMKRLLSLVLLAGILGAAPLRAELRHVDMTVFGMDCATCAHAMSVSIQKIPGVESVNVNINRGLVTVTLKPGNTVTMEQIRTAILDDAFTPKGAQVVVIGELASQDGKLQFKVADSNEIFPVAATQHDSGLQQVGHELTVNGLISAPAKRGESGRLQIKSVSGQTAAKK